MFCLRFKVLHSGRYVTINNPNRYRIDWGGKSASKFQKSVKDWLYNYWYGDIVFEEFPQAGTRNRYDFFNASKNIIVEAHGQQHTKYVPFFHGSRASGQINQLVRDRDKERFAELNGIRLIEVFHDDILDQQLAERLNIG